MKLRDALRSAITNNTRQRKHSVLMKGRRLDEITAFRGPLK
jgi:hypothetical protein